MHRLFFSFPWKFDVYRLKRNIFFFSFFFVGGNIKQRSLIILILIRGKLRKACPRSRVVLAGRKGKIFDAFFAFDTFPCLDDALER